MKKLLSLGLDGGGFDIYLLPNNTVVETGSSGGILDKNEDPIKSWEHQFDTWELWWQNFTKTHGNHWIWFSPLFIDVTVKEFVQQKVNEYDCTELGNDFYKDNWNNFLNYEMNRKRGV